MIRGKVGQGRMMMTSGAASTIMIASPDESALAGLGLEILTLFGVDKEAFPFLFLCQAKSSLSTSNYSEVMPTH